MHQSPAAKSTSQGNAYVRTDTQIKSLYYPLLLWSFLAQDLLDIWDYWYIILYVIMLAPVYYTHDQ